MKPQLHGIIFMLLFFIPCKASSITLYPEIPELYTNITIEINVTGNEGDVWNLTVVTPSGNNETIASGVLDESGNFVANYSYNSSSQGTYYANILLNSAVNATNSWRSFVTKTQEQTSALPAFTINISTPYITGTQNQSSFVPAFTINISVPYLVNATQNQSSFVPAFTIDISVPYVANGTQNQSSFTVFATGGLRIPLFLNNYFPGFLEKIRVSGEAKVYYPNGTVASCANLPINFYLNEKRLLYNPAKEIIEESGTEQTYTDAEGKFEYLIEAPPQPGIHTLKANMTCAGYKGENTTHFAVIHVYIRIIPEGNFLKWNNASSWSMGIRDIIYLLAKEEKIKAILASSSSSYIELNFSHKNKGYVVFTKKNEKLVKKRVNLALNGKLFKYPKPNFGYELGKKFKYLIILSYPDVIIVGDSITLFRGIYNLYIEHISPAQGKKRIKVSLT